MVDEQEVQGDDEGPAQEQGRRGPDIPHIRTSSLMRAHIALLNHEIIQPSDGELFNIVSYHYQRLRQWHSEHTGWHLEYRGGMFKLLRQSDILLSNYGKNKLQEARDFACLVWVLSYAASRQLTGYGGEQQFLLSHLIQYIIEQSYGADSDERIDFERKSDRYSMMRALKYLRDIGGLQLIEGQEQEWIEHRAEVLYEFTNVASLFITSLDLHAVVIVARHRREKTPLEPTLLSRSSSHLVRAWRILLTEPAFFHYDDPEGFTELSEHAEAVARAVAETFGWLLEINRNYACIVYSSGTSTNAPPLLHLGSATDQIIALLCRALREEVAEQLLLPDTYGCVRLTLSDIEYLFVTNIRPRYGQYWGKEAQDTSAAALLRDVLKKMRQVGLLRGPDGTGDMLVLPLAARFDVTYGEQGDSQRSKSNRVRKRPAVEDKMPMEELWSDGEDQ